METWEYHDAVNHFEQIVEKALNDVPQFISRHPGEEVVVVSLSEFKRLIRNGESLFDFLSRSPLFGSNLDLGQNDEPIRDLFE